MLGVDATRKTEISSHKENNPNVSFETIGFIFSEKWGKKVSKSTAIKSYHLNKTQKENGFEIDTSDKTRMRLRPKKSYNLNQNFTKQ